MPRIAQEAVFHTFDDTPIFYRHWPALSETPRGAVVLFHRGHEHSGRLQHLVDELDMDDFSFFAWDARGHGKSPGDRGDAPGIGALERDIDCFTAHIRDTCHIAVENMAVLAQSVGAVLATAWVLDYAPPIRALVLASPAFSVKLYVPFALPALKIWEKLHGNFFVTSYVKAKFLTHDPERIASFNNDPLITRAISARILTGLYRTGDRIVQNAEAIQVPTQLFISRADFVVRHFPQHAFFNNLPSPDNERHILKGFYHDTLGELQRSAPIAQIREFISARFDQPRREPDLTRADVSGPAATRLKWLQTPYPAFSLKGMYYTLSSICLRSIGKLSQGVRLGCETGFDSGSTLDYVYKNKARGTGPLGRFIDWCYLNSPGWSGIRVRKTHVEEMISLGTKFLREKQQPVHVLDIAAGHGRYILDALQALPNPCDSALLRDFSQRNVQAGNEAIKNRGMEKNVRFVQGDAFAPQSISSLEPRPTLAVVSGLYELFPSNDMVSRSLEGLAQAVPAGGYLVYTNQPWHPQLEYIARVLTSHKGGEAWAMRCRTQVEMDQLVCRAGFEKITQRVDDDGIFTVSLACRLP